MLVAGLGKQAPFCYSTAMSDTQLIKDKLDIVDLVGEYVQLKPAGVNHKGLCPFHREKSPSFMVNRERQSWHCFGCSKGGDVFSFIQEIEGMEFVEALKLLAQRAGVPLSFSRNEVASSQKNRIKDINTEAARFFHRFLLEMPAAGNARAYLKQRGLKDETIEEWQVGFIPDQWELLTQYLLKKGHGIDDLVASGLTVKKDGSGFYDRFRGRIMFPIWDAHDTVVGFTGRILVETEHSGGKYVNTPQTPVYDKSRVVFGLNKAKQEIKQKDQMVMVEGQMDVIACHQAGMRHVVATSGTAMTDEQVKLLKRYSNNMAIAFDADAAGVNAAKRGIDIAMAEGMSIKVVRIPEGAGKDADECLKKNPRVWFDAVGNAEDIMDWYFAKAFRGKDPAKPRDKQKIADELLPDISRIPYAVERDHWMRELAGRIGVDTAVLREDMIRLRRSSKFHIPHSKGDAPPPSGTPKTRIELLFERFSVLRVRYPSLSTPDGFALYETLTTRYTATRPTDETLQMQGDLLFGDVSETEAKNEMGLLAHEIKKEWRKEKLLELQREMVEAERDNDIERLRSLHTAFESLRA